MSASAVEVVAHGNVVAVALAMGNWAMGNWVCTCTGDRREAGETEKESYPTQAIRKQMEQKNNEPLHIHR